MTPVSKRRKLSNGDSVPTLPQIGAADTTDTTPQDSKNDPKNQRRSLFVRSLPASVTTERLVEHFSQSYPLKHATVVLDKVTGISRGFGFVTFTDADDAHNAVKDFNDSILDGRKIKVEVAESRNREIDEDIATGRTKSSVNVKGQELRAVRQKQQEENRPPKLIVRNLPWSIKTSEDLTKLFLSYGKVKHAVVPKLPQKVKGGAQPQAGFGIVILRGKKNAEKALAGVNGKEVDGRVLAVDWAVDRETWEHVKENQKEVADEIADVGVQSEDDRINSEGKPIIEDTSSEGSDSGDEDGATTDESQPVDNTSFTELTDDDQDSNEDNDITDGEDNSVQSQSTNSKQDPNNTTVFIRNLPYTADDNSVYGHFKTIFGPVRYARVVYDTETERSRGTAFVSFYSEDVARDCVKNAPKHESASVSNDRADKKRRGDTVVHSLLQNEMSDPSGKYTLEGRVLQITRALPKVEADKRAEESSKKRSENKRRLYLLSEGTIPRGSQLYNVLGKAELDIRESSSKQRQKLVKENPNLGLSLARLSVRNIPRSLTSKELKSLAREAIVGFAKDVKEGKRQPLSKEELTRGGEEDQESERIRKQKGKGIVKQVKIVFESDKTGSKVGEGKGGRSRGYGFIEYYGHRHALMGLRWLNGHLIKTQASDGADRNRRLIVEFAIENAQVVQRRAEREERAKGRHFEKGDGDVKTDSGRKRKRDEDVTSAVADKKPKNPSTDRQKEDTEIGHDEKNKIAARNRIIAQKRHKRKTRKGKA